MEENPIDPIIQRLKKFEDKTPSKWREDAEFRRNNSYWLKYSRRIAVEILFRMEELKLSKQDLAVQLDITEEYLAKILKGQENLTLEAIAKIENVLGLQIMRFKKRKGKNLKYLDLIT